MQERRTTIRVRHVCRAPYCPGEDLLPREGRVTTISERGVGMLIRDDHREGERLTVNVPLPDEPDPLTITGVVRWSSQPVANHGWHPSGLEWLPMEDAARRRLQHFLHARAKTSESSIDRPASAGPASRRSKTLQRSGIIAGASLAIAGFLWGFSLRGDKQALVATLDQRDATIAQLRQQETLLRQELGATKSSLASTTEEIARLDQQAQFLGHAVEQLGQEVEHAQSSFGQLREDREQLMQRLLDLLQERAYLIKRMDAMQQLDTAIQDAIETRRGPTSGNQGYVVGEAAANPRPTLWIRVHDPEALESK